MKITVHGNRNGPDFIRISIILALKNVMWTHSDCYPPAISQLKDTDNHMPVMQYGSCFFEGSLIATIALEQLLPEPSLFPNGNCGMPLALGWWGDEFYNSISKSNDASLLMKNCTLITRQIADGRDYLQGGKPGLADVHSFSPLKALDEKGTDLSAVMGENPELQSWYNRMNKFKAGEPYSSPPLIPPTDYPECDALANKRTLTEDEIIFWQNSLIHQ